MSTRKWKPFQSNSRQRRGGRRRARMARTTATPESHKPPTSASCSLPSPVMAHGSHNQQQQHRKRQKRHQPHHHQHQQEEEEVGRRQHGQEEEQQQPLLPGLPDHLAQLCLARLPPRLLFSLCRSWRRFLYSSSFPPFLSLYALLSPYPSSSSIDLQVFDPVAAAWQPLPHHPQLRHFLLRHPAFLSRPFPVQSVAVSGRLVLVAGTTHALLPALPQPLVFHPTTSRWTFAPPLLAPRRWCAAGAADGSVYVASGVGHVYSADVARSVERWEPFGGGCSSDCRRGSVAEADRWEKVAPLWDGRFSREAVELVASEGKLCIVNVKGKAAKDGAVYDLACDLWDNMPPGLLAGWTGPAAAAPLEAGGCSTIYVVDEVDGDLRAYDWSRDAWTTVFRSERLRGASQMAAGGGRVCIACSGGDEVVVVDVAGRPARMWTLAPPEGHRVVALHVLPRMSRPEHEA